MTNLDSILKSRDITLSTNVCLVKAMVFPVVMYGCESWTIKKAECRRIDAFELWCWRRLLRVPWTARRSNQSILKEISLEGSLEGLMLKLKLQYLGHLMQRAYYLKRPWCWERLKAGGEGDDRGWDGWMASLTPWTWVWVSSGSWWWAGRPVVLQSNGLQSWTRLSNWTELNWTELNNPLLPLPSTPAPLPSTWIPVFKTPFLLGFIPMTIPSPSPIVKVLEFLISFSVSEISHTIAGLWDKAKAEKPLKTEHSLWVGQISFCHQN